MFPTVEECVKFHGHLCGGITMGYVMSRFAMDKLGAKLGDPLYCIAEFQNCMTDAVQCVTGCTAGKGNLVVKDYGKRAMTLVSKITGEGYRVTAEFNFPADVPKSESAMLVMEVDPNTICKATPVKIEVPEKIHATYVFCDECKEEFAKHSGEQVGDKMLCHDCAAKLK